MKKNFDDEDFEDEILDDEFIDDDVEELEDDAEGLDDEIIYDDEDVEYTPKTKKPAKKKMNKGAKIAIIISSTVVGVVAIVLVALLVILPLVGINIFVKSQSGNVVDNFDFSQKLTAYKEAPTASASWTKINEKLTYDEEDMAALFNGSSDKNLIAAQMIYAAEKNIATAYQYSYFKNQVGTTDTGSNSGTLIVQRMRRQNQTTKDDTTLKLPINHNFNAIYASAVSSNGKTAIRYVRDSKIYRINSKSVTYDEKTGLLGCDSWSKGKNFGTEESVDWSANLTEARFNYLSLVEGMALDPNYKIDDANIIDDNCDITKPKAIFKKSSAKIEDKNTYYEITVEVDPTFANADEDTMNLFNKDNGTTSGSSQITKCNITVQIWKCGLFKEINVDEVWSGTISGFAGNADAKSQTKYSYNDTDCNNDSVTEAIWKAL